jgi:hypothetical protein
MSVSEGHGHFGMCTAVRLTVTKNTTLASSRDDVLT